MLQGEHSAILLIFIKLPFAFKTFVLSIYEWPLKTGFTVFSYPLILTCVLGAQNKRLVETVLLSTHNICFDKLDKCQ